MTALVFAGDLGFNPETDELTAADGSKFKFTPPTGEELPKQVFKCYTAVKFCFGFCSVCFVCDQSITNICFFLTVIKIIFFYWRI